MVAAPKPGAAQAPKPQRSLRGAIDGKCRDCGAFEAGRNWREYIAVCPVADCSLWEVRPLPENALGWMLLRDKAAIPDGWLKLRQEDALASLRNKPGNSSHTPATPGWDNSDGLDGSDCPELTHAPESGSGDAVGGVQW